MNKPGTYELRQREEAVRRIGKGKMKFQRRKTARKIKLQHTLGRIPDQVEETSQHSLQKQRTTELPFQTEDRGTPSIMLDEKNK